MANNLRKKLIQIDVSSDSICPWCFAGKRNLDKAIVLSKEQFDFEINGKHQLSGSQPPDAFLRAFRVAAN
ncbi:hypothetical protein RJ641_006649 [Dillenia turbinata]|uniref:DSBA-like thioredoxin domain-containing protein n=1 Tax=Dillenia turbinata TaxID=194707 RepID=A0AAN8V471_9MAGN